MAEQARPVQFEAGQGRLGKVLPVPGSWTGLGQAMPGWDRPDWARTRLAKLGLARASSSAGPTRVGKNQLGWPSLREAGIGKAKLFLAWPSYAKLI